MEHSIWGHCSFRYTQLDPSHHQQPLLPPAPQLCPHLRCQFPLPTAATAVPIAHHLPCFLTASNSSTSSLWTKATALSSGSLSSSKCFFFQQELIQLCFPSFYPLATIAGTEPRSPSLLLLSVALFHLCCSTPLKHVSRNHLCHSSLPARELLRGTLKRGANELKLRMRLIQGAEEGRNSQE